MKKKFILILLTSSLLTMTGCGENELLIEASECVIEGNHILAYAYLEDHVDNEKAFDKLVIKYNEKMFGLKDCTEKFTKESDITIYFIQRMINESIKESTSLKDRVDFTDEIVDTINESKYADIVYFADNKVILDALSAGLEKDYPPVKINTFKDNLITILNDKLNGLPVGKTLTAPTIIDFCKPIALDLIAEAHEKNLIIGSSIIEDAKLKDTEYGFILPNGDWYSGDKIDEEDFKTLKEVAMESIDLEKKELASKLGAIKDKEIDKTKSMINYTDDVVQLLYDAASGRSPEVRAEMNFDKRDAMRATASNQHTLMAEVSSDLNALLDEQESEASEATRNIIDEKMTLEEATVYTLKETAADYQERIDKILGVEIEYSEEQSIVEKEKIEEYSDTPSYYDIDGNWIPEPLEYYVLDEYGNKLYCEYPITQEEYDYIQAGCPGLKSDGYEN